MYSVNLFRENAVIVYKNYPSPTQRRTTQDARQGLYMPKSTKYEHLNARDVFSQMMENVTPKSESAFQ